MQLFSCDLFESFYFLGSVSSEELVFFLDGLESSVSDFGRSVDELEIDDFLSGSVGLSDDRLSEGQNSLLRSNCAALDHEEVVVDDTVVRETTERSDGLVGDISGSGGVGWIASFADSVDLLVGLGSVVITELTSSRNGSSDSGRMPCTNATNFSVTSVCFLLQMLDTESLDNTSETFTLGNSDNVDHLVFSEEGVNADFLFEKALSEVDLVGNGTTVNLDFEDLVFLLTEVELVEIGMGNDSNDRAVLLDSLEEKVLSFLVEVLFVMGEGSLL